MFGWVTLPNESRHAARSGLFGSRPNLRSIATAIPSRVRWVGVQVRLGVDCVGSGSQVPVGIPAVEGWGGVTIGSGAGAADAVG